METLMRVTDKRTGKMIALIVRFADSNKVTLFTENGYTDCANLEIATLVAELECFPGKEIVFTHIDRQKIVDCIN